MIAYVAMGALALVPIAFVFSVQAGILAGIVAHPITSAAWYQAFFIGPVWINPVGALGIILPTFVLLRAIAKGPSIMRMPLVGIWLTYILYFSLAGTLHAIKFGPAASLDLLFRHLAGFMGFYMVQAFFSSHDRFRQFLIALILSGLFPVAVILYQVFSGEGTLRSMSEGGDLRIDMAAGLARSSGFYHDIVPVRGYTYQCLAGILLYWTYYLRPKRDTLKKVALAGLGVATLFVLYKMYSKAAIVTMIAWFIIWCVGYRRLGLGLFIAVAFVGINLLQSDLILKETGQLFEHEFKGAASDATSAQQRQLLHGRVGAWENMLTSFQKASVIEQFFGLWAAKGAHNDYLQKLFSGGFIGLGIYLLLLTRIGMRVAAINLRRRTPINLVAAMVFCGWMIDTIGVVPSVYPGYQWYAWGLIGLALKGLDFEPEVQRTGRAPGFGPSAATQEP